MRRAKVDHPFALELDLCFWSSTFAREPVARRLPWSRFRDRLAAPPPPAPSRDKREIPLFSPTKYKPGTTRAAANVLEVTALVLDYDGSDWLTNAAARWADWPFVAYTTWSHGTKGDGHHFRIVLPLARPVPASAWSRVFAWAQERDPFIDPSCKDPSRIWMLPFTRPGAPFGTSLVNEEPSRCLDLDWERPANPDDPHALPDPEAEARARRQENAAAARRAQAWLPDDQRARSLLLKSDPVERARWGEHCGGRVVDRGGQQVVKGVTCPACGRASLWWPTAPDGTPKALCEHKNSCGAMFWLDQIGPGKG